MSGNRASDNPIAKLEAVYETLWAKYIEFFVKLEHESATEKDKKSFPIYYATLEEYLKRIKELLKTKKEGKEKDRLFLIAFKFLCLAGKATRLIGEKAFLDALDIFNQAFSILGNTYIVRDGKKSIKFTCPEWVLADTRFLENLEEAVRWIYQQHCDSGTVHTSLYNSFITHVRLITTALPDSSTKLFLWFQFSLFTVEAQGKEGMDAKKIDSSDLDKTHQMHLRVIRSLRLALEKNANDLTTVIHYTQAQSILSSIEKSRLDIRTYEALKKPITVELAARYLTEKKKLREKYYAPTLQVLKKADLTRITEVMHLQDNFCASLQQFYNDCEEVVLNQDALALLPFEVAHELEVEANLWASMRL
jgi:hypothetical protein